MVVDFHDASWDTSYAWGYRYDGIATAEDMLNDIAAADINFDVTFASGFLNDITYNNHVGLGGNPNYFSTYTGTDVATLALNAGVTDTLTDGSYFACSYEPWPSNVVPGNPIAAFDPNAFTVDDCFAWVGTGQDTAILIVDFHPGTEYQSFAWGYAFDGPVTGQDILDDIASADANFAVASAGGWLNDITYNAHAGIGGSPFYWGTWSGTNMGNLDMNAGLSTTVNPGEIFGCSYTTWDPVMRPDIPGGVFVSVQDVKETSIAVYPQPAQDVLNINVESASNEMVRIYDLAGQLVVETSMNGNQKTLNIAQLNSGVYLLEVGTIRRKIIKQ